MMEYLVFAQVILILLELDVMLQLMIGNCVAHVKDGMCELFWTTSWHVHLHNCRLSHVQTTNTVVTQVVDLCKHTLSMATIGLMLCCLGSHLSVCLPYELAYKTCLAHFVDTDVFFHGPWMYIAEACGDHVGHEVVIKLFEDSNE